MNVASQPIRTSRPHGVTTPLLQEPIALPPASNRPGPYDRMARFYDLVAAPSEAKARKVGIDLLAPEPGDAVLEVGSGTGHSLVEIGERVGDGGRVVGLDLSIGMTQLARARLGRRNTGGAVSLILGDARALPIAEASFDRAFMNFTLELLSDFEIRDTLAELSWVLRPGGSLAVVTLDSTRRAGALGGVYGWFRRHFPELADCRPIDAASVLEQSGFEVIGRRSLSLWSLPVAAVVARSGVYPKREKQSRLSTTTEA